MPVRPGFASRSFANVVSVIALALSLGAGSMAVASHLRVQRSDIVNNAVNGSKVAKDSLTGRDIKERKLGKVPNADKVDGLSAHKIYLKHRPQAGNPSLTVLRVGGLWLKSQCYMQQPDIGFPFVTAYTTVDNAQFRFSFVRNVTVTSDPEVHEAGSAVFGKAGSFELNPEARLGTVTFTYRSPAGRVISGILGLNQEGPDCFVTGTAIG